MKVELFSFQRKAVKQIMNALDKAQYIYAFDHSPQVISFTAPTGAGKTIIMAALIEELYYGNETHTEKPECIFVWLSDSPQLNEQSRQKIDLKADRIRLNQCVTIQEDSFDQEVLDDGHIYFLNTQKLAKSSNLVKKGDSRNYTIWETLANTAEQKGDHLFFIIDEAHRGMHGKEASIATTIMQKFIKGSTEDAIYPMPFAIGMSATMDRFNRLVGETASLTHKCVITTDEVRASGLLKDHIIITYPDESDAGKEMMVLHAAAADWKEKWNHWLQYCQAEHVESVNPVLVVQVLNATGTNEYTDTDLEDCISKIEQGAGIRFEQGEVVHSFGQTGSIKANGLNIEYAEPSSISDNRKIKLVFFKESLSTGWDCPRAETMMSFRSATDATYIAQLLGRMVRTPLQRHIEADDVLNDVHLYLPNFNENTVRQVVDALQNAEGGEIPTDIYGESLSDKKYDILTINPLPNVQQPFVEPANNNLNAEDSNSDNKLGNGSSDKPVDNFGVIDTETEGGRTDNFRHAYGDSSRSGTDNNHAGRPYVIKNTLDFVSECPINRSEIVAFINNAGLLSYSVCSVRISDYLSSLFKMAHLLSQSKMDPFAFSDVTAGIVEIIHAYTERLKSDNTYDDLSQKIRNFRLKEQIFDPFGKAIDNSYVHDLFMTTDLDIDRQFRIADHKLCSEGIGNAYGSIYYNSEDPQAFKIDVILFASDPACLSELQKYSREQFNKFDDLYRRKIAASASEKIRTEYNNIVTGSDAVSKHVFHLPENYRMAHESDGKEYRNHLYVEANSGTAMIRLNSWEESTLHDEEIRDDFVCWIRNPSRGPWALTIPYKYKGEDRAAYPDFIIVRSDKTAANTGGKYIIDILEPHNPSFDDNVGKAIGLAEYARQNPIIGRVQLIRSNASGCLCRLDMSRREVRDKVMCISTPQELDNLFNELGVCD